MCCVGFCLVLNACGMYCGFVSSHGFYPVIDCMFGIIFLCLGGAGGFILSVGKYREKGKWHA